MCGTKWIGVKVLNVLRTDAQLPNQVTGPISTANHKLNKHPTETKTYEKNEITQHTHHLVIW